MGYVVIQESVDSLSVGNVLKDSDILESGSDGIQIQGDFNKVTGTTSNMNGGYGVHLCSGNGKCVVPGTDAVACKNLIVTGLVANNTLVDIILSGGNGNRVRGRKIRRRPMRPRKFPKRPTRPMKKPTNKKPRGPMKKKPTKRKKPTRSIPKKN